MQRIVLAVWFRNLRGQAVNYLAKLLLHFAAWLGGRTRALQTGNWELESGGFSVAAGGNAQKYGAEHFN